MRTEPAGPALAGGAEAPPGAELQDDTPVKLTIELPGAVHRNLVAYAEALSGEGGAG